MPGPALADRGCAPLAGDAPHRGRLAGDDGPSAAAPPAAGEGVGPSAPLVAGSVGLRQPLGASGACCGRRWGRCSRCGVLRGWPQAVRLTMLGHSFWAPVLYTTFTSITLGALFDAYLLILGGSNTFVGEVESIGGLTALAVAVPIGWACDRFHKPAVLRVNMVFGVASAALLLGGLFGQSSPLLIAAVVAYAAHTQAIAAVGPALIAELVESGGTLTQAMGDWMTTRSLAQASGPALQIVAIAALGTAGGPATGIAWSLSELLWILVFGLVFLAVYASCAWRVHRFAPAAAGRGEEGPSGARPLSCSQEEAVFAGRRWLYAGLAEAFALITAVGSGMTFKYWPLFFKGDFRFSPSGVCLMQLLIWTAIAAGSQLTPIMARCTGRLPSALLLHVLGTGLLFVISNHSLGPTIEVPLVLVRNCVMNSATPLVQAHRAWKNSPTPTDNEECWF
ncbi:unnamed protein product [Prorocentrum cordatum]|uniref:Solute carrier family 40 protein n=1 Tax=Prorocentrum cordatum TaxID=2364126 RepID=A0ABN9TS39_9DINO|nr:unnamed protein product [Polarella glacialis]